MKVSAEDRELIIKRVGEVLVAAHEASSAKDTAALLQRLGELTVVTMNASQAVREVEDRTRRAALKKLETA